MLRSEATSQRSIGCAVLSNCSVLSRKREMRKSVITCALALLVCLSLTCCAQAATVDANEEWEMEQEPYESFTCIAHFIPDVPNVPDSLIFPQASEWTDTYPFDYVSAGWNTTLADAGKTAYLFGPTLTNDGPNPIDLFSYRLYYQWDNEDPNYDPDYPVYLDVVVFNDQEIVRDFALRGIPNGPYDTVNLTTWREQDDPGSDPYENPVPEPMTICLLGLGSAFLRRRRSTLIGT